MFVLGVFWKRATATAALATLVLGTALSLGLGIASFNNATFLLDADGESLLPHFLLQSFGLFCMLLALMVVVSLATEHRETESELPTMREAYQAERGLGAVGWALWGALAVVMAGLYLFFHWVM